MFEGAPDLRSLLLSFHSRFLLHDHIITAQATILTTRTSQSNQLVYHLLIIFFFFKIQCNNGNETIVHCDDDSKTTFGMPTRLGIQWAGLQAQQMMLKMVLDCRLHLPTPTHIVIGSTFSTSQLLSYLSVEDEKYRIRKLRMMCLHSSHHRPLKPFSKPTNTKIRPAIQLNRASNNNLAISNAIKIYHLPSDPHSEVASRRSTLPKMTTTTIIEAIIKSNDSNDNNQSNQ